MRFLRLAGLVASVAATYFANYIFQQQSLSKFFPGWALQRFPALYPLTRWLPEDLLRLALWISLLGALVFGLVATSWPTAGAAPYRLIRIGAPKRRIGRIIIGLALVGSLAVLGLLFWQGEETWYTQSLWAAGILAYLLGSLIASEPPLRIKLSSQRATPRPEQSWPLLLLLLGGFGLLWGWQWWTNLLLLNPTVAELGLQAQAQQREFVTVLFSGESTLPPLATATLALFSYVSGDTLAAFQITGLLSTLICLVATWVLGCELFRRRPRQGQYEETLEDQGQWVVLLAVALLIVSPVIFYFSQYPVYLEPVAWGILGLWALLHGLRLADRLAVGLSGVLLGWATLLYPSGLVFLPVAIGWWIGVWLLQPGWLQSSAGAPKRIGSALSFFWIGGLLSVLAPQIGLWIQQPTRLSALFVGNPLPTLDELLMLLSLGSYHGAPLDFPSAGLSVVIAPLVILALGNLLLNLDRLVGWLLFVWTIGALVIGSLLAPYGQYWPVFLPLLPALVLSIALMLDRLRLTWLETAGTWSTQAITYLITGLVLWAGLLGWLAYDDFRRTAGDPVSRIAQQLTTLNREQSIILVQGEGQPALDWENAMLQLVAQSRIPPRQRQTAGPDQWPNTLAPQSSFVLQPADQALLTTLQARYPDGQITVRRDLLGNPVLYLYNLP